MWKFFENYFTFTRKEKNGIIILISITIIVLLGAEIYTWFKPIQQSDNSAYETEIKAFQKQLNQPVAITPAPNHDSARIVNVPVVSTSHKATTNTEFEFDPNTITAEQWMQLGFTRKQAMVIEHYRQSGAIFRKPEDLKKLYVMSPENYERLKPYVRIKKP